MFLIFASFFIVSAQVFAQNEPAIRKRYLDDAFMRMDEDLFQPMYPSYDEDDSEEQDYSVEDNLPEDDDGGLEVRGLPYEKSNYMCAPVIVMRDVKELFPGGWIAHGYKTNHFTEFEPRRVTWIRSCSLVNMKPFQIFSPSSHELEFCPLSDAKGCRIVRKEINVMGKHNNRTDCWKKVAKIQIPTGCKCSTYI